MMKSYTSELNNQKSVKSLYTIITMAGVIGIMSCSESDADVYIQSELVPYFESFVEEGALRGVDVDFGSLGIEGFISETTEINAVGQCTHSSASPNKVTIDAFFWRQASNSRKEFVIFHELGHCYLGRSHLDDKDENGICKSIMQSSADACTSNYENERSKYLDELFIN